MIIPLGPGSHRDSSSLPEGHNERGSSPLLFGLAPRGVCRASDVATGAVGSYPTVSPLPCVLTCNSPLAWAVIRPAEGFSSSRVTEVTCTGGLFSVALSVAESLRLACACPSDVSPLALPGASPNGVRTFLPARLLAKASPAITRLARHRGLYLCRLLEASPNEETLKKLNSRSNRRYGFQDWRYHFGMRRRTSTLRLMCQFFLN